MLDRAFEVAPHLLLTLSLLVRYLPRAERRRALVPVLLRVDPRHRDR